MKKTVPSWGFSFCFLSLLLILFIYIYNYSGGKFMSRFTFILIQYLLYTGVIQSDIKADLP